MVQVSNFLSDVSYRSSVWSVTEYMKQLREISESYALNSLIQRLDAALSRLLQPGLTIAVVGDFKRGKTTFINALMGRELLPSDILPNTAVITRIRYGLNPEATICFVDGREERVPCNELSSYVSKLAACASRKLPTGVAEAIVEYPLKLGQHQAIEFVDTPGLGDEDPMTVRVLDALRSCDAAIMLISAQTPFSETERDFLKDHLYGQGIRRVLFIINRIDLCASSDDADRVVNYIKERIERCVQDWATQQHCVAEKSQVFGVSALQALRAREDDDVILLDQSRFEQFEHELLRLIEQEAGAIRLQTTVYRLIYDASEITSTLEQDLHCLTELQSNLQRRLIEIKNNLAGIKYELAECQRSIEITLAGLSEIRLQARSLLETKIKSNAKWFVHKEVSDNFKEQPAEDFLKALATKLADSLSLLVTMKQMDDETKLSAALKSNQEKIEKFLLTLATFNNTIISELYNVEPERPRLNRCDKLMAKLIGDNCKSNVASLDWQTGFNSNWRVFGQPNLGTKKLFVFKPDDFIFPMDLGGIMGSLIGGSIGALFGIGFLAAGGATAGYQIQRSRNAKKFFNESYPALVEARIDYLLMNGSQNEYFAAILSDLLGLEELFRKDFSQFMSELETNLVDDYGKKDEDIKLKQQEIKRKNTVVEKIIQDARNLGNTMSSCPQ